MADEGVSPRRALRIARAAGICYLLMGVGAAIGFHHAPMVLGDPAAIGRALIQSETRYRVAVIADVLAMVCQVPLAVLLYELFRPVDRVQAGLMAVLLVVSVPITWVVSLNYVAAQWLLGGTHAFVSALGPQREGLAALFLQLHTHGVLAEEILWGLWLLPFGWLVLRSRFLPRILGVLLIVGGVAYVAHSLHSLWVDGVRTRWYERLTMAARAAAELPTILWLLVRGADTGSFAAHRGQPGKEG